MTNRERGFAFREIVLEKVKEVIRERIFADAGALLLASFSLIGSQLRTGQPYKDKIHYAA
jgi:hypothetical protein